MMFVSGHGIYWRLSDEDGDGADAVSVVLTNSHNQDLAEVMLDTDLTTAETAERPSNEAVDIEWNKRDLELFLALFRNTVPIVETGDDSLQIELDLTDDSVGQILRIVAAARFATPQMSASILNPDRILKASGAQFELGDTVSIDTIDGLKAGIIVDAKARELHCALLEEVTSPSGDNIRFNRHDIIVLPRELALPGALTSLTPGDSELIH